MTDEPPLKVSVIVPTRNRAGELSILLEALGKQTRLPDEVVIVDASDSLAEVAERVQKAESLPWSIRQVPASPGANHQRNLGAKGCGGEFLFFFDDDVAPAPDYIELLLAAFERHPEYHGGMGTVRAAMARWSIGSLLCRLFLLQHEHGDGRFGWSGMPRHPYGTWAFRDVEVLDSGMMALRRSVFMEDGIEFDERMTLSQQDADFSRRLSRRRRLFFEPRAQVEHRRSLLGRPGDFEQGRRYMFNYRYLYFKNFYPCARWTLPAHWWTVAGMFLVAAATSGERFRGYAAGFNEFLLMRRGKSLGLFEPSAHP